jgi:hypothetical protein
MSAPIGPGDWVECVDASPHRGALDPSTIIALSLGALYQVREVADGFAGGELRHGLLLVGLKNRTNRDGLEFAYDVERFRPIYRPKSSIIEQLKQPAPEAVRELEDV